MGISNYLSADVADEMVVKRLNCALVGGNSVVISFILLFEFSNDVFYLLAVKFKRELIKLCVLHKMTETLSLDQLFSGVDVSISLSSSL